jgi:aspartyl/glutamyl-tRNA(Asn/Gln) amidotransferase subunit A (EC 6.3.5.-)
VAARLLPATTGTDTGGSIRQPAALTNLTGLKPTYGRVSRWGMIAYASSLDQGGPLARTAEDCALLLQGMAGFDAKDSTSIDEPVPDYSAALNGSLQGLRIGLPKDTSVPASTRASPSWSRPASRSWKSSVRWSRKSACRTCSTPSRRTT